MGPQCSGQVMHQADVAGIVEAFAGADQAFAGQQGLDLLVATLRQEGLPGFLVDREITLIQQLAARRFACAIDRDEIVAGLRRLCQCGIDAHLAQLLAIPVQQQHALRVDLFIAWPPGRRLRLEFRNELVDARIEFRTVFGRSGDDQRCAGFVDQDRVDLVDDRVIQAALHLVLLVQREVVAQVVEAEFVVGAVGDVGGISLAFLGRCLSSLDHTDPQTEKFIDRPHPVGIALGQVLVDGDDMHTLAGQRIQVGRQGRHQGLAFTGAHLGDLALVQGDATEQLLVEMPQADGAVLARRASSSRARSSSASALARATSLPYCLSRRWLRLPKILVNRLAKTRALLRDPRGYRPGDKCPWPATKPAIVRDCTRPLASGRPQERWRM